MIHITNANINQLLGKKFRRNVYGPSLWEDIIIEITFDCHWNTTPIDYKHYSLEEIKEWLANYKKDGFRAKIKVKGLNSLQSYDLDEIVIYP